MYALTAIAVSPEDADKVQFPINGINVEGNTLISTERLQQAIKPFLTQAGTIDQLQSALQAIEKIYAEAGYSAIKAVLPEQEADAGIFRILVVEAKLGSIKVVGNKYYDQSNILNTVPGLHLGETPNLNLVAKTLRIANESFAKNARVVLARSPHEGKVDAEIRVVDQKQDRFIISLDNTGSLTTGRSRLGFIYQNANVFNRDHAIALQYTTSPERLEDVTIFGISYRIPLYRLGDTMDFSVGHSDVNSGNVTTTSGTFGISGSGDYASANYNLSLPAWRDIEQKLIFSANWRSFNSEVVFKGSSDSLIPDLTSAPASVTYLATKTVGDAQWQGSIGWVHNFPIGSKGDTKAYNQDRARPGADASFDTLRYSATYLRPFIAGWNAKAEIGGQLTRDMLIVGEQYGLGGAYSVRAFNERELSGDSGYRASLEVTSPEWEKIRFPHTRSFTSLFYDLGQVTKNNPLQGELAREKISSAGVGFKMLVGQTAQLKLDIARVMDGDGIQRAGDFKGHFQILFFF